MTPYHFAILRYQQSAASGEQVNVGVALWAPAEGELRFSVNERFGRLSAFFGEDFDGRVFRELARDLEQRAEQVRERIAEAREGRLFSRVPSSLEEILADIAPRNAACFQWSEAMGGVTNDTKARFEALLDEYVFRYGQRPSRPRRNELEVWHGIRASLRSNHLAERLQYDVPVTGKHDSHTFKAGWKNGVQHVMEGISFDYADDESLRNKAHRWWGLLADLRAQTSFQFIGVVAPPASEQMRPAFEKAMSMLRDAPAVREIVEEAAFESVVVPRIGDDLSHSEE